MFNMFPRELDQNMEEKNQIEGNTKCGDQTKANGVAKRETENKPGHGTTASARTHDRTAYRRRRRHRVVQLSTLYKRGQVLFAT